MTTGRVHGRSPRRAHERVRAAELQGQRAGFVSRIAAAAIDAGVVFVVWFAALAAVAFGRYLVSNEPFDLPDPGAVASSTAILAILVVVLTVAWSGSGRTVGNAAVGLRVVTETGGHLRWPRAFVRAVIVVAFPVLSLGWILVSRKNAGWHDLACRTTVVYDWRAHRPGTRPAPEPDQSRPQE